MEPRAGIDNIIANLAKILATEPGAVFRESAQAASASVVRGDFDYMCWRLHNRMPVPPEIEHLDFGLGQWLAACQYAIFELFYNLHADSLNVINAYAYGEYDWTQATALEVLCRLVVYGKIPDDTIDELNSQLGDMRYETHLYLAQALLRREKKDERFRAIIQRLDNSDFQEAIAEILSK